MLVSYRRSGGPKPRSDELLEIEDSGAATLRRVVSSRRAGSFAGTVEPAALDTLKKAVDGVRKATVTLQAPSRPPYETEELTTEAVELRFHPVQKLPKPVAGLRDLLRDAAEELLDQPVAAVEVDVDAGAGTLRLGSAGTEAAETDWQSASASFDLFGRDEALLTSGVLPLGLGGSLTIRPGWAHEVALPALEFDPERTLQVRVTFSMRYPDGAWREVQITSIAGRGWD